MLYLNGNVFKEKVSSKECLSLSGILYSISNKTPMISLSSSWAKFCEMQHPRLPERLRLNSALRLSQNNHMLVMLASQGHDQFVDDLKDHSFLQKVHFFILLSFFQLHFMTSSSFSVARVSSNYSIQAMKIKHHFWLDSVSLKFSTHYQISPTSVAMTMVTSVKRAFYHMLKFDWFIL